MTTKAFYLTDKTLDSLPQWLIDNRESGPLDIYINSTGGDILSAISSISLISSHKDTITTYITGSAESAALLIAISGHTRIANQNSFGMVHPVSMIVEGTYHDHMDAVKHHKIIFETIKNILLSNSLAKEEQIDALMGPQTTWLRPHDLINFGFIDFIVEVENLERIDGKDKTITKI